MTPRTFQNLDMLNIRPKIIAPAKDGPKSNHRTSLPIQVTKVASAGMFLLQKKNGKEDLSTAARTSSYFSSQFLPTV